MKNAVLRLENPDTTAFLDYLGELLSDFEVLRRGNRILSLSAAGQEILTRALQDIRKSATNLGFLRLSHRAHAVLATLDAHVSSRTPAPRGFLVLQALSELNDEMRHIISTGSVSAARPNAPDHGRDVVLFVDDEDIEREIVVRALGPDVDVITAADVASAVDLLGKTTPSLILLDMNLGAFSGTDLLALLQRAANLRNIPVVMRSNHYDDERVVAALAGGALDYIPKSVGHAEFRARTLDIMRFGRSRTHAQAPISA